MTKETKIVLVSVKELKMFSNNPKKFKSKIFSRLLDSIKKFGIQTPLIVSKRTRTVIDGNQRLKAAIQLGIKDVPVKYIDLEPDDEALMLIHLNTTLAERDEQGLYELAQKYKNDKYIADILKDFAVTVKNINKSMSPEFEIVREIDESYDYIVFISKRSVDYLNFETFFNLQQMYDPQKEALIGKGRVVDGALLSRLIDIAHEKGIKNSRDL